MGVSSNHYTDQEFRIFPSPNLNNNTIHLQNADTNSIAQFYNNSHVFVTGASGFLGKALLEKLLRTCNGINTIHILLRSKRGLASEQRLKEMLQNPVFDRIREKDPSRFDKIKIVEGDVTLPQLGLKETDRTLLAENVDIVFHSAATIRYTIHNKFQNRKKKNINYSCRFNENLKDAVVLNTLGTKRVMELCTQMLRLKVIAVVIKNVCLKKKENCLQSVIHVSTAYSNADKKDVEEIVYAPPHDPQSIINCIEALPADAVEFLQSKLLVGFRQKL